MPLFLDSIILQDFRNYTRASFHFYKPYNFIIGPNACGKSNLLEAIQAVSYGSELRAEADRQLVRFASEEGFYRIESTYHLEERSMQVELIGGSPSRRRLRVNQIPYRSRKQASELLPKVVTFRAKQSLEVVSGAPGKRRDWLDTTLGLIDRTYSDNIERYEKALEQRNCLLRQSGGRFDQKLTSQLEPWSFELIKYGVPVQAKREAFLTQINPMYSKLYGQIAGCEELATLQYLPEQLVSLEKLNEKITIDLCRGLTTLGPQRDDFTFQIDHHEARHYASQGQQRTCALALAITQAQLWGAFLEYSPILLLDDVAAELDLERQAALFSHLPLEAQIFLTTTHLTDPPKLPGDSFQIHKFS